MLIEHNVHYLNQAIDFINGISDELYVKPSVGGVGGGIGPHFRHCIEHYESLVNGLPSGKIDYDLRKRDLEVERSRSAAVSKLEALRDLLPMINAEMDKKLLVKTESHATEEHDEIWVESTFGRELISVISHTVHHFALISFVARYYGVPVSLEFGMAPSTLKYMAGKA